MTLPKITVAFNWIKIKTFAPFVLLALVILSEVLLMAFYFPGKVFQLLDLRDKATLLSVDVKQLAAADAQLSAVDQSQLTFELAKAEVALPDEKKVAGLITGLVNVASSSGVMVKGISFSPGRVSTGSADTITSSTDQVVGDGVRAIPVNMSVAGSLTNFLDYLAKLKKASQLLGVTGISYSLLGPAAGGDMSLVVYYLPARSGMPTWQYIPAIAASDLEVLSKLSPQDVFNLPGVGR